MDIKTLEYLEEKVQKSRGILSRMETLEKNIKDTDQIDIQVHFVSKYHGFLFSAKGGIPEKLKKDYIKYAIEEIEVLKKQLAKL